jgi:hypothetical protein
MRNLNCIALSHLQASSPAGPAIDSNQLLSFSAQAVFSDGSAAGTLKFQASDDIYNARYNYPEGNFAPSNWSDIPNATAAVTSGGTVMIPKTEICYRWIRAVFTTSAGAGTVIVSLNALSL